MKIVSKIAVAMTAATAFMAAAAYASGGNGSPSVAAGANATVVVPVLITQTAALNFGTFSASPTQGGTIDSSGNATGGVNKVTSGTPATFTTTGLSGASYTIVGDPSVTLVDSNNSSNTMLATLTYPNSPRTLTGGNDSFNVSGVLTVAAGQFPDPYAGTYNVSVHY